MRIGIITMHRVRNLGSSLQTYALQRKMFQLGYDAEIIDYSFPSSGKSRRSCVALSIKRTIVELIKCVLGISDTKRNRKIDEFLHEFVVCSEHEYDRDSIRNDAPQYDIYCTGSDQVWNPNHIKDDMTFFLDFAPDHCPKISYAASFAIDSIPLEYTSQYSSSLKKYNVITVREKSGVEIVKKLTGKDATVVCDPTLLLDREEWSELAQNSSIIIKGGYIVVYLLRYMFDPSPYCYDIVSFVQKKLKLPVYCINGSFSELFHLHSHNLSGVGPIDFISLIRNASFVITDSFHGTAMATVFNVPVLSIIKNQQFGDGRVSTLRNIVGCPQSVCAYNSFDFGKELNIQDYLCDDALLRAYRTTSIETLNKMIEINS